MLRYSYRTSARAAVFLQIYKIYLPLIRLRYVDPGTPSAYDFIVIGILISVIIAIALTGIRNFKKLDRMFPEKTGEDSAVSIAEA